MDDLCSAALCHLVGRQALVFGVRGSVVVRRRANLVTLRDGHGIFSLAVSGPVRMAANNGVHPDRSVVTA